MQLSETVQQFVVRYINSVDQLEMLLLLRENDAKSWTAEEIARALFTQAETVQQRLAQLAGQGLLTEKERTYRYSPRTTDLERAVSELAREYPRYRVSIINLIFSKPIDRIRTFADAFRFTKEEDDKK
jgi:predicted transcriptional regulator